jgi:hypothetical protein
MAPTKRASKQPGAQRDAAKAPRGTASTPAAKSDLYAWAVPAFSTGSPVDHTWVTTYDNRVKVYSSDQQVAAAGCVTGTAGAPSTPREGPRTIAQAF